MKLLKLGFAALMLTLGASAIAQEDTRQTLVIEGASVDDIYDVYNYWPNAMTYKLYVELDTTATLVSSSPVSKTYEDAVVGFDIEFFDAEGVIIAGPPVAFDGDLPENVGARANITFNRDLESESVSIAGIDFGTRSYWIGGLSGPSGSIFADFDGFPTFVSGSTDATLGYTHFGYTDLNENYIHFDVYGEIASLGYLVVDVDGDGFADNVDTCPASILDETMLFDGWYDSGVTNYVDANGCTVADHYAACEAVEEEAPRRGIRSVRSGPSSCEKAVSYDLVADGVISYAEARLLREALYESSSSNPR